MQSCVRCRIIFKLLFFLFISSFLIGLNSGNIHAQQKAQLLNFSFGAAGDWGCDKKAQNTVRNMQNKSLDLVLALGDLSYQKNADCWFDMMSPLLNKTKIAIGTMTLQEQFEVKGVYRQVSPSESILLL